MQVSELFLSVQGEGRLTGTPMYFIRAQGCAVKCPIREVCDQPESLPFKAGTTYTPAELATRAFTAVGSEGWVCLTGGEPLEQRDFAQVVEACRAHGLRVNLQTSGLYASDVQLDWATVSPKAAPPEIAYKCPHELKVIYTGQTVDSLASYYTAISAQTYFLQPCWRDGKSNQTATLDMVYALNRAGQRWSFSAQWHKYLGVH